MESQLDKFMQLIFEQLIDLFTETTTTTKEKNRVRLRLEIACMTESFLIPKDSRNFPYANLSFALT